MARIPTTKYIGSSLYLKSIPQSMYKKTREAKLCLLICSMYPTNFNIPLEDLAIYGMGLMLFEDVHTMLQARSRIHELIDIINNLIHNNILVRPEQDEYGNQYVKMLASAHNIARQIARSYGLNVMSRATIMRRWPNNNAYENCDVLSLMLIKIRKHPVNLECPELAILQLKYREDSKELPDDFFVGMKKLPVLSLDVPSLPQSLTGLHYLRTLHLKVSNSKNMYWIGNLKLLEFIRISTKSPTAIPKQMRLLRNLRLLDLRNTELSYIPPGVFSKMLKLEELYLPLSFKRWGRSVREDDDHDRCDSNEEDENYDKGRVNANLSETDEEEGINASFEEIVFLSLNALETTVLRASMFPKISPVLKHVKKFKILLQNNPIYQPFGKGSLNKLQLTGDAYDIKESGLCDLLRETEDLSLIKVSDLKNVTYQLTDYDFPKLKKINITECHELEYLGGMTNEWIPYSAFSELKILHLSMLSNLKEIWHGPRPISRWFENLGRINIRFCHKLEYVFSSSMARGLRRLKSIEILDCKKMVGIFYGNKEDAHNDMVDSIEELHLHSLPSLVGVLVRKGKRVDEETNHFSTTNEVSIINNKDMLCQMETFCVFSSELIDKGMKILKKLKIAFCDALRAIFVFKENHSTSEVLNSLEELELHGLRNLKQIWYQIPSKINAFQKLRVLILSECRNLSLLSPRIANLLVQLQKIQISRCEMMKAIVLEDDEKEVGEIMGKILFPQLKALELQYMPNLRVFYGGSCAVELPLLESLKFTQCNKMDSFSYRSSATPLLERLQIDGRIYSLMGDLNATLKRLMVEKLKLETN